MQTEAKKYNFNVILLGNYQVGKTALCQRLCNDVYEAEKLKITYGVGFMNKEMEVDGKKVVLNIRDTAGDERYQSLMKMYYNEVHGVVIVYDITCKASLDKLKFWIDDLDINGNAMECRVLVGNKRDLEGTRQVPQIEAKTVATMRHMDWCECSAKAGEGVLDSFQVLVRKMVKEYDCNPEFRKIGCDESFVTLTSSICPVADVSMAKQPKKQKGKKTECC